MLILQKHLQVAEYPMDNRNISVNVNRHVLIYECNFLLSTIFNQGINYESATDMRTPANRKY